MTVFTKFFRCLCLCSMMQKGSWSPAQNVSVKNEKRANYKQKRTLVKRRFNKDLKSNESKPEWLKQWTISKGWLHNRSHLLTLGVEEQQSKDLLVKSMEVDSEKTSSISTEDIDDLLSIASVTGSSNKQEKCLQDFDKIETLSDEIQGNETNKIENKVDGAEVFTQIFSNYRKNFPDNFGRGSNNLDQDLHLPEIYKERLLLNKVENTNFLMELWKFIKPKKKSIENKNYKFTVNKLYDSNEIIARNKAYVDRNVVSKSQEDYCISSSNSEVKYSSKLSTFRPKTNLLEDTIYECSEESASLYHNPLYGTLPANKTPQIKYYDFHTNHACRPESFVTKRYQLAKKNNHKLDSIKYRLKTEKYIIRHIKVRIMFSLKIGRFQKVKPKPLSDRQQHLLVCADNKSDLLDNNTLKEKVEKMHEHQRRIGNGKTSIKIQNMR